jgi:hypothetical protein
MGVQFEPQPLLQLLPRFAVTELSIRAQGSHGVFAAVVTFVPLGTLHRLARMRGTYLSRDGIEQKRLRLRVFLAGFKISAVI